MKVGVLQSAGLAWGRRGVRRQVWRPAGGTPSASVLQGSACSLACFYRLCPWVFCFSSLMLRTCYIFKNKGHIELFINAPVNSYLSMLARVGAQGGLCPWQPPQPLLSPAADRGRPCYGARRESLEWEPSCHGRCIRFSHPKGRLE